MGCQRCGTMVQSNRARAPRPAPLPSLMIAVLHRLGNKGCNWSNAPGHAANPRVASNSLLVGARWWSLPTVHPGPRCSPWRCRTPAMTRTSCAICPTYRWPASRVPRSRRVSTPGNQGQPMTHPHRPDDKQRNSKAVVAQRPARETPQVQKHEHKQPPGCAARHAV